MTPEPPLGDEELAKVAPLLFAEMRATEAEFEHWSRGALIAALRASRADNQSLDYLAREVAAARDRIVVEHDELNAEVERLRKILDDIYPSVYGRAVQLDRAGETVAAAAWSAVCRRVAESWTNARS